MSENRITELQVIHKFTDFKGNMRAVYSANFNGEKRVFVIFGKEVKVLVFYHDHDALEPVTDSVRDEILELFELKSMVDAVGNWVDEREG
jgi:hypothetical protein